MLTARVRSGGSQGQRVEHPWLHVPRTSPGNDELWKTLSLKLLDYRCRFFVYSFSSRYLSASPKMGLGKPYRNAIQQFRLCHVLP